jgi:hypothetical protein
MGRGRTVTATVTATVAVTVTVTAAVRGARARRVRGVGVCAMVIAELGGPGIGSLLWWFCPDAEGTAPRARRESESADGSISARGTVPSARGRNHHRS